MPFRVRLQLYLLVLVVGASLCFGLGVDSNDALTFTRLHTRSVFFCVFGFYGATLFLHWKERGIVFQGWWTRRVLEWPAVLFVIGCTLFSVSREPFNFKVTADEYVLSAEAFSMHFEGYSHNAVRTHEVNGVYRAIGGTINKRPPVFVTLLSLIHDVTGYRVVNVFALNVTVTLLFFGCWFWLLAKLFNRQCAYFGCVLFSFFPLLYQNASGAGFELLNLLFIVLFVATAVSYLETGDKLRQRLFVLTALLLANIRYESSIFVVGAALIILFEWWKSRRVVCDVSLYLAPLIMTAFLFRMRSFETNFEGNWQLEAGRSPFALEYFYDNVGHALNYCFSFIRATTTSEWLYLLGIPGLFFFVYGTAKDVLKKRLGRDAAILVTLLIVIANFVLLLTYHWGQIDSSVVTRLVLPISLLCAMGACYLFFFTFKNPVLHRILWLATLAFGVFVAVPRGAMAASSLSNYHVRRADWTIETIRSLPRRSYLVATSDVLRVYLEKIPAIPIGLMNVRVRETAYHHQLGTFSILVVQRFFVDPKTRETRVVSEDRLHPAFKTETIAETSFRAFVFVRLSRVVFVDHALLEEKVPKDRSRRNLLKGDDVDPVSEE